MSDREGCPHEDQKRNDQLRYDETVAQAKDCFEVTPDWPQAWALDRRPRAILDELERALKGPRGRRRQLA